MDPTPSLAAADSLPVPTGADRPPPSPAPASGWRAILALVFVLLVGEIAGSALHALLMFTVLRSWIPSYYDYGWSSASLRLVRHIPRVLMLELALSNACVLGCAFLVDAASRRPRGARLGLRGGRLPMRALALLIPAAIGAAAMGILLSGLLERAGGTAPLAAWRSTFVEGLQFGSVWERLGLMLFVGGFAGLVEEVTFRGVLQRGLLRTWRPPAALLTTAALFSLAHGSLAYAAFALPFALLAGWVAWKDDAIRFTIACHVTVNLLGEGIGAFSGPRAGAHELGWALSDPSAPIAAALRDGLILLAVAVALVWPAWHWVRRWARSSD